MSRVVRVVLGVLAVLLAVLLSGCVTVNVTTAGQDAQSTATAESRANADTQVDPSGLLKAAEAK